jgi:glycosyltransferase involved in cell wall biosynthesis
LVVEEMTDKRVTVAVVVLSHNRAEGILETLDSLRAQDEFEQHVEAVYLADDCSTDNTVAVAKAAWAGEKLPLHVVQPPRNLGTYGNTNHAIERVRASHDWVLCLHDDDIAKPHWVRTLAARVRGCAASVASVSSSWDLLFPDGSREAGEDDLDRPVEVVASGGAAVRSTVLRGCWWHFSGCALRTSAVDAVGPFDAGLPQCADWDWLLRCLAGGWDIEYVPRTLIGYRQHGTSVSSQSFLTHRDILENLIVADRYGQYLTPSDVWRFHMRLETFVGRRGVRAVLDRRPAGVWQASKTGTRIARSFGSMMTRRLRTSSRVPA